MMNFNEKQIEPLLNAMVRFEGIIVFQSAVINHNLHIWFRPDSLKDLPPLLYWFDKCHCGFNKWSVKVYTDCGMSDATFVVINDHYFSERVIEEANTIAQYMNEYNEITLALDIK